MTSASSKSGGDFLAKKSDVMRLKQLLPSLKDILVVDDETFDADRLKATLRVMFGYDLEVRRAATVASAVDAVMKQQPELIFLDDCLKPSDTATTTIPYLRRADFTGPIVVVSGQVTRNRRRELMSLGAAEVIHKDDVDSTRLAEALLNVYAPSALLTVTAAADAARAKGAPNRDE
jgi:DNA-binding NarL/FixJ family response regulator